jgi:beta-1,4-mannosyl-glycoprotein beta-1,4-N-acetylglucosaminyltransferase
MFLNEFDLMDIRLHEMSEVADYFVISESSVTHKGYPKPRYYLENRNRFSEFDSKIVYVDADKYMRKVGEDVGTFEWWRENDQRDAIMPALEGIAKDDDAIIVTDLDEIPKASKVPTHIDDGDIIGFRMMACEGGLNRVQVGGSWSPVGATNYANLKRIGGPQALRAMTYATHSVTEFISSSGWHFSWCGSMEDTVYKLMKATPHSELSTPEMADPNRIADNIANGRELFHGGSSHRMWRQYANVEIDDTFPKYIISNIGKFTHLMIVGSK